MPCGGECPPDFAQFRSWTNGVAPRFMIGSDDDQGFAVGSTVGMVGAGVADGRALAVAALGLGQGLQQAPTDEARGQGGER